MDNKTRLSFIKSNVIMPKKNGQVRNLYNKDFEWLINEIEGKDKILESYARTIDGMMSDVIEIRDTLLSVLDNLQNANATVRLEEHDESLENAIKSVDYLVDFLSNVADDE